MDDMPTDHPPATPENTPAGSTSMPENKPPPAGDQEKPVTDEPPTVPPAPKHATDPADKDRKELHKLELEIEALKFKHSIKGRLLDVMLAVGQFAAFATLIWTVHVGLRQQDQQRLDAANGRFERAYAKLGSQLPTERASGVAQLSALLHTDGGSRDQEMLTALVNQLALDDNPAVSAGILNIFDRLDKQTGKVALDSALQNVVHMQNVLVKSSGLTPFELSTAWRDERGQYLATPSYDPKGNRDPQPVNDSQIAVENLYALKSALVSLLKAGGTTQDMKGIFCPSCDFGQLGVNLSGVSFRNAILNQTRWNGLRMEGSDFQDAILDHSTFWTSNLQHANFSQTEGNRNRQLYVEATVYRNAMPSNPAFNSFSMMDGTPDFTCSDLRNANFDNYPLLVRSDDPKPLDYGKLLRPIDWSILYRGADIAGTNFQTIREIILIPIQNAKRLSPYARINLVAGPEGARYHYYAEDVSLRYLQFELFNKKFIESESGQRNLEAIATALSETRNYEKAKLPSRVLPLLQSNPASHQSKEAFCDGWRKGLMTHVSASKP